MSMRVIAIYGWRIWAMFASKPLHHWQRNRTPSRLIWAAWLFVLNLIFGASGVWSPMRHSPAVTQITPRCATPFAREHTKLKDHSIFQHANYLYLASIEVRAPASPQEHTEHDFAYARTSDFCTWEDLGNILGVGLPGEPDESAIWAPHVIEENGLYYMFYTGVNRNVAQSIMLAVSDDPANPASWVKKGVVFRPNHTNMIYHGAHKWSDARDPMVLKQKDQYYLYYTGKDTSGGVVGVAIANQLTGPWRDWGAVAAASPKAMAESPYVIEKDGVYYLMFNDAGGNGPTWSWAVSPLGPWQNEGKELIGWAHDFFRSANSQWWVSYVMGNGEAIRVQPLNWFDRGYPLRAPLIGHRIYLPIAAHELRNETPNSVIKLLP